MTTQNLEQVRVAWDNIAAGYDDFVTPTHIWLAKEALHRVDLRPAESFLDVACGSGALSIPAARLGAHVTSVDIAPHMIERLLARARKEGLTNLEARVMDGHALELEDNTFDVVGSEFGVMLFPDLPRALRELVRVTKPAGRVLMVVYGPPTEVEFLSYFLGAMKAAVPGFTGLPTNPPPLPFQVADPQELSKRLTDAGLRDVRVDTTTEKLEFESGRQMWNWVVNSNPIGAMLVADLTEEQKSLVRQVLDGMLRERSGGTGPAVLTNPVHIGIGTK